MARVFRFSLDSILELRVWEEKQSEFALAAKTGECTLCENEIKTLAENRKRTGLERGRTGLDLSLFAAHEAYRLRLSRKIERLQEVLARLTVEREDLIEAWKKARQKREILSKLREKKHFAFERELIRRESLQIDDLNTASYIRKLSAMEGTRG